MRSALFEKELGHLMLILSSCYPPYWAESHNFTGGATLQLVTQTDDIFISLSKLPLFMEDSPS